MQNLTIINLTKLYRTAHVFLHVKLSQRKTESVVTKFVMQMHQLKKTDSLLSYYCYRTGPKKIKGQITWLENVSAIFL